MEDEPVSTIRETARNMLKLSRRFHRDEESDYRRPVTNSSVSPESIEDVVDRLKTKSTISISELQLLKNGLMEDPKYAEVVLNTHGALRGLVRELTGNEARKQCAAAGCFCNLGLADSKAGAAVAKAAGPYLVAALDSLSSELAMACTWAVGNLAGSGAKASALLAAQGALTKLCNSLHSSDDELRDAAMYALTHFAYQIKDELRTEHLTKLLGGLTPDITIASSQLLFISSCHKDFHKEILQENTLQYILTDLPISIKTHFTSCLNNCSTDCKLLNELRILANVNLDDNTYEMFLRSFKPIIDSFRMLLRKEDVISKSLLWLLGNLYNYKSDHSFFRELLL